MQPPKIKKIPLNIKDDYLVTLITLALNMITGNPHFLTPSPTLAVVQEKYDNFWSALTISGAGGAGTVAIKNQQKKLLVDTVNKLIRYLNFTAEDNLAILQSTGLPISSGISLPRMLGAITSFTVVHGKNSGEAFLKVKAENGVGGMYSYTNYPVTESSIWVSTSCRNMTCTISDLTPGNKLAFQVRVMGSNEQFLMSQYVSLIVV